MSVFFQNHEIQIYRRRRRAGTDRFAVSATYTAYKADIQPTSPERAQLENGRYGAVYDAYVETTANVKEGDEVRIIGGTYAGKVFGVKGVAHWDSAGMLDHTQLVLVSKDG